MFQTGNPETPWVFQSLPRPFRSPKWCGNDPPWTHSAPPRPHIRRYQARWTSDAAEHARRQASEPKTLSRKVGPCDGENLESKKLGCSSWGTTKNSSFSHYWGRNPRIFCINQGVKKIQGSHYHVHTTRSPGRDVLLGLGATKFQAAVRRMPEAFQRLHLVGGAIIHLFFCLTILKNDGVRQWEGWHPIYDRK